MNGNSVAYDKRELGASAESGSDEEVSLYRGNRDNLLAIRGYQEYRSVVLVKLHDNTGRVLDGVNPWCLANVVNYTASAIIEANGLPKVRY